MKLLVAILVLIPVLACATPVTFMWDPNPPEENVIEYVLYVDGSEIGRTAAVEILVDMPRGPHTVTVTARNQWLESEPSDPLNIVVTGKPQNVHVK